MLTRADVAATLCFDGAVTAEGGNATKGPRAELLAEEHREFERSVAEAATSRRKSPSWLSAVRCVVWRADNWCEAFVRVVRRGESVEWSCARCGESGVIAGFAGTQSDLSRYAPHGRMVIWGLDEEERDLLEAATASIPELRAVLARAMPDETVDDREYYGEVPMRAEATVAELDAMYTLVEDLTDGERYRDMVEILDGIRASLCTSMDGW